MKKSTEEIKYVIGENGHICSICGKPFIYIGDIIPGQPVPYCEGHGIHKEEILTTGPRKISHLYSG